MSFTIDTLEDLEELRTTVSVALIETIGGPAIIWSDENGHWHGVRAVSEVDGPWHSLPEEIKATFAVPVDVPFDPDDDEAFVSGFTVLWADGEWTPRPPSTTQDPARGLCGDKDEHSPLGQDYVLVHGGLVQNEPALPVFDLDVLDAGVVDVATLTELVELHARVCAHPSARRDLHQVLARIEDLVREHGSPQDITDVETRSRAER